MAAGAAVLLGAIISALAAGGSAIASNAQTNKYRKELKKSEDDAKAEMELQQRRGAIAKALTSKKVEGLGWLDKPIQQRAVKEPNNTFANTVGALGQGAGNIIGAYGSNMAPQAQAPVDRVISNDYSYKPRIQTQSPQVDPYASNMYRSRIYG
jgi:hypothetical protein